MKIWIVDAFTNKAFRGNPAAICLVENFPKLQMMQDIAMEMSLSQTAFVRHLQDLCYHIKWFTPNSEAPLCGHATIAAHHVLMEEGYISQNQTVVFSSLSGDLIASYSDGWVNLNFPSFNIEPINITPGLLQIVNQRPIYVGLSENCILMEFADPAHVQNLIPDLQLLAQLPYRALIATSYDHKYDFISRYFAPRVGINEDPVCGSAHCRLIPYWSRKLGKSGLTAYQASKRGGVIKCQLLPQNRVLISGQAVVVLKGELNVTCFK